MRPDDGGIDDQILKVRIIGHRLEDPLTNPLDAPTTEAPERTVPTATRLRKLPPGRARPNDPQYPCDKHPIVAPGRTFLVRSTNDQRSHPLPRRIAQNQPVHHTQDCLPKAALNLISS